MVRRMSIKDYFGIGVDESKISKMYFGVNGIARKVKKIYEGDENGLAREIFSSGSPIGTLAVDSSVFMNVNGVRTEFLIVHQGIPSTSFYDASCNGTWLLMKNIYTMKTAGSRDYSKSNPHKYLNGDFLALFDDNVASVIKQVKIPYTVSDATAKTTTVYSGANGLSTKIFLLSLAEVGYGPAEDRDGYKLSYNTNANYGKNVAYYNGVAEHWFVRTTSYASSMYLRWIYSTSGGAGGGGSYYDQHGIRPALILPSDTLVDTEFNVIA